jgi:hypothetical protein
MTQSQTFWGEMYDPGVGSGWVEANSQALSHAQQKTRCLRRDQLRHPLPGCSATSRSSPGRPSESLEVVMNFW